MLTALRKLTPVRAIFLAFTVAVWIGIGLLMLSSAKHDPGGATFTEAFFTATSASVRRRCQLRAMSN